ncbi:hypothetical protein V9K67_03405 [Paraflavisolibacter sp. H34]|uniref:hypothetical protein n=1 Tax=Huijunlia imazamoxiresistens TaxID=3127457 RepID=UPI0030167F3E
MDNPPKKFYTGKRGEVGIKQDKLFNGIFCAPNGEKFVLFAVDIKYKNRRLRKNFFSFSFIEIRSPVPNKSFYSQAVNKIIQEIFII